MCAVYRRKEDGPFYMNFTFQGSRVFKSTGKLTLREAKREEALEKERLLKEANLSPEERKARTMLSDVIKEVYALRWKNNKDGKQSLARAEKIISIIGDVPINQINQSTVVKITLFLESKNNKPATINRTLEILKTMLKHKKQEWDYIKVSKTSRGRIRVVSKQEEQQIVKLFKESAHSSRRTFYPDIADLVICLVDTGMRLGEMLKLKYEDVNFSTNLISIWINKGGRPRSIPMTKRVRVILEARKETYSDKPFNLQNDQAITAMQWVRKEMGLEHDKQLVCHALRHTCASRLLEKGCDLVTIKEWLGHADITTTMIYAHMAPNKLAHAAAILDNYE